jgi:hypothetical protein
MTSIRSDGGLDRMKAILQGISELSAVDVAPQVDTFMRGQMEAGETPEGEPWQVRKRDGGKPLRRAAANYEQRVSGNTIVMRIRGRHAFHHFGAQEKPVRRQLPEGSMPKELGNAIRLGFVDAFKARTKAGKRGYAYYRKRGRDPRKVK